MKEFNEEVKEKREPTKATTRVERVSLGLNGNTLEPWWEALGLDHIP